MGQWHMSDEVNAAVQRLLDELTSWERTTGRECLLVMIPKHSDESLLLADSGKPWQPLGSNPTPEEHGLEAADRVILALLERARSRRP